jgi:hypothetical protein
MVRTEQWKTKVEGKTNAKWSTFVIFVPKGAQVIKSRFNQAEYNKYHKRPLTYECEQVMEIIPYEKKKDNQKR